MIYHASKVNKKGCISSLVRKKKYLYFDDISSETVKRLRPFARRAANILRPFAVDIRSLKPCLFLLLRFDG
jgi:hypothetical protein